MAAASRPLDTSLRSDAAAFFVFPRALFFSESACAGEGCGGGACVPCCITPTPTPNSPCSRISRCSKEDCTRRFGREEKVGWSAHVRVCARTRHQGAPTHRWTDEVQRWGKERGCCVVWCVAVRERRARSPDRLTDTEKTANARHRAPPPYQKKKGGVTMDTTTRKQRRRRKRRESTTTTTPPMTLMMLLLLDDDDGGIDRHDTARQRKKSRGTDEHLHQTRTSDWCIGGRGGEDGDKNSTSFMAHARARPFSSHRTKKKKTNHSSQRSVLRCDVRGWGVG